MTVFNLDPKATPRSRVYHQSNPELQFDGWSDESASRLVWGSGSEAVVSLWDLGGPPDAAALALRRPGTTDTKQAIFDPRGKWLAVANTETLTFWAVSQPWVRVLRGHTAVVNQLRFTPDSRGLVSCASDNARRWPLDPAAGEASVIENLGSDIPTSCYGIAVSPDGTQVLRGMGGVKLVNLHGRGRTLAGHGEVAHRLHARRRGFRPVRPVGRGRRRLRASVDPEAPPGVGAAGGDAEARVAPSAPGRDREPVWMGSLFGWRSRPMAGFS